MLMFLTLVIVVALSASYILKEIVNGLPEWEDTEMGEPEQMDIPPHVPY